MLMNRVGERARWARIESDIARAINAGHVVSYDWNVWRWRERAWFLLLPNGEERAFSTREVERWLAMVRRKESRKRRELDER